MISNLHHRSEPGLVDYCRSMPATSCTVLICMLLPNGLKSCTVYCTMRKVHELPSPCSVSPFIMLQGAPICVSGIQITVQIDYFTKCTKSNVIMNRDWDVILLNPSIIIVFLTHWCSIVYSSVIVLCFYAVLCVWILNIDMMFWN